MQKKSGFPENSGRKTQTKFSKMAKSALSEILVAKHKQNFTELQKSGFPEDFGRKTQTKLSKMTKRRQALGLMGKSWRMPPTENVV